MSNHWDLVMLGDDDDDPTWNRWVAASDERVVRLERLVRRMFFFGGAVGYAVAFLLFGVLDLM